MTSVSELIGFFVIQIVPSQSAASNWMKHLPYRNKNPDYAGEELEQEDNLEESDSILPRDDATTQNPLVTHQPVVSEPVVERNVAWKPDFWLVAFVMSMRITTCRSVTNPSERLWSDVYKCKIIESLWLN
jgi:hypothetical protein